MTTSSSFSPVSEVTPFVGYVETTLDALRVINAAQNGVLQRITHRLNHAERKSMIKSGAVFVFDVQESGIERWTDNRVWSPSYISGNFLVYWEKRPVTSSSSSTTNILTKMTITMTVKSRVFRLISYSTSADISSGRLEKPNSRLDIMMLDLPPESFYLPNFQYPPKVETGSDGRLRFVEDARDRASTSSSTTLASNHTMGTMATTSNGSSSD